MSEFNDFQEWYGLQTDVPPRLTADQRFIVQCILDGVEIPKKPGLGLAGDDFTKCLDLINRFRLRQPYGDRPFIS